MNRDDAIGAVVFDVDDTLVDFTGATARGLRRYLTLTAPHIDTTDPRTVERWRELEELHFGAYLRGECTFPEQRRRRARSFCSDLAIALGQSDDDADTWIAGFLAHAEAAFALFPDVVPVLDWLERQGIRVAAMSNSNHAYQDQKLSALGIRNRMEALVCCDDVGGAAKPDSRIFRAVCHALALPPDSTAYVGDRLDSDALAAKNAGLAGIWLDRTGHSLVTSLNVPVISSLYHLCALLSPSLTESRSA